MNPEILERNRMLLNLVNKEIAITNKQEEDKYNMLEELRRNLERTISMQLFQD
tara:strand:- start:198 stop:356 length:159 start_codon:yes stop_codon:yes gene_type:complete